MSLEGGRHEQSNDGGVESPDGERLQFAYAKTHVGAVMWPRSPNRRRYKLVNVASRQRRMLSKESNFIEAGLLGPKPRKGGVDLHTV